MVTKDYILKEIDEFTPLAEDEAIRKYYKDYDGGPYQRELLRLRKMLKLVEAGAEISSIGNGCVYIQQGDYTFRYYLLSGKWSSKYNPDGGITSWRGRNVYRSKSEEDFVKRYVLEDKKK